MLSPILSTGLLFVLGETAESAIVDAIDSQRAESQEHHAEGGDDAYFFAEGTHARLWHWLGAHWTGQGTVFRVWAPNASQVSVVGDFNNWDENTDRFSSLGESGVWQCTVQTAVPEQRYKYAIWDDQGRRLPLKADPLARRMEPAPNNASIICRPSPQQGRDAPWQAQRASAMAPEAPISIYEVHTSSWRRNHDGSYLSYQALADQLIPYVKDLGFTHIQLMPMSEYPFDGSWGYQPVGLYAPTSRHGSPEGYREFINACHAAGLGVLQDWVPAHFPGDEHGLARFDGTALYEHQDPRKGFHPDWNTCIYSYGRHEVDSFLLSNAMYWLEEFQIDGLRVDAVASMLYLDYSRSDGEWIPNQDGGRENYEAMALLRAVNERIAELEPTATTIAEESTAWPGVTAKTSDNGLGFGYKWNMGWMHDTLRFMGTDPVHRSHHLHDMTFGLSYAFSESYVLPLSHDEVVHGKGSLLERMPGDNWQKFANLRAYYGFMWTHPGKKLLFMGGEFGQPSEWNHDDSLQWECLDDAAHRGLKTLIRDLNRCYRTEHALHVLDCQPEGFDWIAADDTEQSVIAFLRLSDDGAQTLTVCNFTPVPRDDYRIGVPVAGTYQLLINTDETRYGGSGYRVSSVLPSLTESHHGRLQSLSMTLPPLATMVLKVPKA